MAIILKKKTLFQTATRGGKGRNRILYKPAKSREGGRGIFQWTTPATPPEDRNLVCRTIGYKPQDCSENPRRALSGRPSTGLNGSRAVIFSGWHGRRRAIRRVADRCTVRPWRRVRSRPGGQGRRFSGLLATPHPSGLLRWRALTIRQGVCKRPFARVANCRSAAGWLASRLVGQGAARWASPYFGQDSHIIQPNSRGERAAVSGRNPCPKWLKPNRFAWVRSGPGTRRRLRRAEHAK
jgi:hypothetical protein